MPQTFAELTGYPPRPYQERVAEALAERRHILLRAPTGAGKTLSVLAPFLLQREAIGARRLIYTLPMRTLAQGIHAVAAEYAKAVKNAKATIQTGAQPDDPFFDQGDVVVCTYDQLLSGFLCGPYGLPDKLYNINAAAVAGNLVVFDEFHLMDADRAFRTAVECVQLFQPATLSVWMTATATTPLCDFLASELGTVEVALSEEELRALYQGRGIRRTVRQARRVLELDNILTHKDRKTLVVVNRVARAQELYRAARAAGLDPILLHSKFFAKDRASQREKLDELFGNNSGSRPALAIATQVVEAGLDLSAEVLLTELCPMNALVQRAGRCARFERQQGEVWVFDVSSHRPYGQDELDATASAIQDGADLDPATVADWVERVHRDRDRQILGGDSRLRRGTIAARVQKADLRRNTGISEFIRETSDTVRVIISRDPMYKRPAEFDSISVWRNQLRLPEPFAGLAWNYCPEDEGFWKPVTTCTGFDKSYLVCLSPPLAHYTPEEGLLLGEAGDIESYPIEKEIRRPYSYHREALDEHVALVVNQALSRVNHEATVGSLLRQKFSNETLLDCARWAAKLHDLGKLQVEWDGWVRRYQKLKDPNYLHTVPLGHTDFDPKNPRDWECQRQAGKRPPHAAASAIYGRRRLREAGVPRELEWPILYAIVSHHGGSWECREVSGLVGEKKPLDAMEKATFDKLLKMFCANISEYWPLASYLARTLRLADQKATEDYHRE
ncbi:MAG: CRISPR-associated helicase Cas3' [Bryobacteraceae bacterium]|nr:CRISPR-associated helicase Cas3' [Bryobacteraceae bacterium]